MKSLKIEALSHKDIQEFFDSPNLTTNKYNSLIDAFIYLAREIKKAGKVFNPNYNMLHISYVIKNFKNLKR